MQRFYFVSSWFDKKKTEYAPCKHFPQTEVNPNG